jgi:hypothetical protein
MTTTTNFKISDGTDLENIFYPVSLGGTTYSTNTGFVSGGTDLKNIFAAKGSETSAVSTGFKISSGSDLNSIFRNINYPVIQTTDGGGTLKNVNKIELSNNGNLCFCFTTDSVTGNKYIQYSRNFKSTKTFSTTAMATSANVDSCCSFTDASNNLNIFYILSTDLSTNVVNYYRLNASGTAINQFTLTLSRSYQQLLLCSISSNGKMLAIAYQDNVWTDTAQYGIHYVYNTTTNVTNSTNRINTKFLSVNNTNTVKNITCSSIYSLRGLVLTSNNILYTFYPDDTGLFIKSEFSLVDMTPYLISNEIDISNESYVNIVCLDTFNNFYVRRYNIVYNIGPFTSLGTTDLNIFLSGFTPRLIRMFDTKNFIISYITSTAVGGFKLFSNNKVTTYSDQNDFVWCDTTTDTTTNEIVMVTCKNSVNIFYTTAINTNI